MTKHVFTVSTGLAALSALVTACVYPTDKGSELRIEVAPITRLIRGDSMRVIARLLESDGSIVPDARFAYSSADRSVAAVTTDGVLIAVNAGKTSIVIRAVGTAATPPAQLSVSVNATVSLDSMRPVVAKWGQFLSLYGSGLGPDTGQVVTINDVPVSVESYQAADSLHPERFGVLRVLAAPPLAVDSTTSASVLVVTSRGAAALSTPFTVKSVDIFWPNQFTPADLGTIAGRREFPGLALEAPYQSDWFSFNTTTAGDWTITVVGPWATFFPAGGLAAEQLQGTPGSVASTFIAYYPGRGSVAGTPTLCKGRGVWRSVPWRPGAFADSYYPSPFFGHVITVRNLPAGQHDLIVNLGLFAVDPGDPQYPNRRANEWAVIDVLGLGLQAGRYDLVIEPGAGSDVARDAYEPNDFCEDATSPLFTLGSTGFTDSVVNLTFDGWGDTDWFRIVAETAGFLRIRSGITDSVYLEGEMAPSDLDSAEVAGHLSAYDTYCGNGWGDMHLVSYGPDGCEVEGVNLQSGAYHLTIRNNSYGPPAPYQMVVTWAPGVLPVAPRTAQGRQ